MNTFKVVNDSAKKEIVLKKNNEFLTDEKENQFLFRVVEHHRKVNKQTKEGIAFNKVD